MAEPDGGQRLGRVLEGIVAAGQLHRYGDVLQCRHRRHQAEALKNDADMLAPEKRETIFIECREIVPRKRDATGADPFEAGDHHHQRRLAGARRTDHRNRFAAAEDEVDAAQDVDGSDRARQADLHVRKLEQSGIGGGIGHRACSGGRCVRVNAADGPGTGLKGGPLQRIVNVSKAVLAALCLLLGQALVSEARAAPARVLVLGDSLTAGFGLPVTESLPSQLEAVLKGQGLDVVILNGGVSGDTTAGGLSRVDWALADNPGYALVALGANDALRGLDTEKAFQNLDAIIGKLKAKGIKVMILGMMAPPNLGRDYGERFAAIFPKLAEKYRVPLYPFLLDGVAADPKLNQRDGIHPNAEGVRIIVARLAPLVKRLLESPG